jgi:hypothetical protein
VIPPQTPSNQGSFCNNFSGGVGIRHFSPVGNHEPPPPRALDAAKIEPIQSFSQESDEEEEFIPPVQM